jgi:hypothetical protein
MCVLLRLPARFVSASSALRDAKEKVVLATMLLSNPLNHHRRLAKCAWLGAMPQVAFRLGVL